MNLLPDQAAAKFICLQDDRDAAEGAARDAAARLSQLLRDADPRLVERLQARRAEESNKHAQLAALVNNLNGWLRKVRVPLEAVASPAVELQKGESIGQAVERTRSAIEALKHRLEATRTAPRPKPDIKKQVSDDVRELAERGRPRTEMRGDRLIFEHIDPQTQGQYTAFADSLAAMAYYFPDVMLAKRIAEIDAMPERADALSVEERQRRMAELSGQIETLERSEEALIEQAAVEGIGIARREDASPAAVLGVQTQRRAAAAVA